MSCSAPSLWGTFETLLVTDEALLPPGAGLYRGISPTLIGVAPYVGVNYLVYETLKEWAPKEEGCTQPNA